MEDIESDIESIITSSMQNFNYSKYSSDDVKRALKKDRLNLEDFKALL